MEVNPKYSVKVREIRKERNHFFLLYQWCVLYDSSYVPIQPHSSIEQQGLPNSK